MGDVNPLVPGASNLPLGSIQSPAGRAVTPEVKFPKDLRPYEVPEHFAAAVPGAPAAPLTREEAAREVDDLNKVVEGLGRRLDFALFEDTGEFYVKVVDRSTNRVVKVLPSEKALQLHAKLEKALGVILDEAI